MRSQLAKSVRSRFRQSLKLSFPGFIESRETNVPPGWLAFRYELVEDLWFYIILVVFEREDRFTLEGAWTRNRRYPGETRLLQPRDLPQYNVHKQHPMSGDFHFRISSLWQSHDCTWDLVPEKTLDDLDKEQDDFLEYGKIPTVPSIGDASKKIIPAVSEAMAAIDKYLIPYYDEVAAEFGIDARVASGQKHGTRQGTIIHWSGE